MRPQVVLCACLLVTSACGGGDEALPAAGPVDFVSLEVSAGDPAPGGCEIPGCVDQPEGVQCLSAKLEATGVPGVCPLEVASDRSVTGTCRTPGKEVRDFRLIWYSLVGVQEVTAGVALTRLDLTTERQASLPISFTSAVTQADVDDDLDGKSNLAELCAGTDPRTPD